jgi:hypothetical protein
MRMDSQRFLLAVLFTMALIDVQTSSAATPSTDPPTSPAAAKPAQPEDLQWNPDGATAQCQDGTFHHGPTVGTGTRTCADHGGVRKFLKMQGRDPVLIR